MDEKELFEKLVKLKDDIGDKKIKNSVKDQIEMFDGLKEILGCSDIGRMRLPIEFENNKDYEKYVRKYVKTHSKDITEYSNRILLLNDKIRVSETEEDVRELYGILMGFSAFLMIKGLNLTDE